MRPLTVRSFGCTKEGKEALLYTMENDAGMSVSVSDYGATLAAVKVPDREGNLLDVTLGYDDVAGYEKGTLFFGAVVGRNANRIGGASLRIQGTEYALDQNEGGNNLHSGNAFYSQRFWNVKEASDRQVAFTLHSPNLDQGYPGAADIQVTYALEEENTLRITYDALPGKDTVLNLTNHSYFNLNGHDSGDVLGHKVVLDADAYTGTDEESIPTGEIIDVTGTPMDFREKRRLGADIDSDYEALRITKGYDHNWCLNNHGSFAKVAQMEADESGISMDVYTDLPGVQMYAGNYIEDEPGKKGALYRRRQGICFETQYYPDAPHHENFPSVICKAGKPWHKVTAYQFRRQTK